VGALVVDWPGYGPWQLCSGTLIHPQIFMTAGHCTYDLEELGIEQVWVNFDPYALTADTLRPVAQVLTHPEFGFVGNNFHDVSLLILEEPVTDIQPATLPAEGYLAALKKTGVLRQGPTGAKFTVVGYGGVLSWPPPEITYEDVREVAVSEYIALVESQLHVSQNILKGDGGTCFGDSGGPIFYNDPTLGEVVVGITSWGDAVCVSTGFYYRVDIPDTLDFIQAAIEGLE
jgi:secreted trypsin-like serine protease